MLMPVISGMQAVLGPLPGGPHLGVLWLVPALPAVIRPDRPESRHRSSAQHR
ncbi:hypothetical protein [Streptomyces sp. NPDC058632]|uniref:hypothetical protein n=1 Tax=unclassified Streptomyces TaxID=2593676 RepID=UPI0036498E4C